jgi:hypothetical protein
MGSTSGAGIDAISPTGRTGENKGGVTRGTAGKSSENSRYRLFSPTQPLLDKFWHGNDVLVIESRRLPWQQVLCSRGYTRSFSCAASPARTIEHEHEYEYEYRFAEHEYESGRYQAF